MASFTDQITQFNPYVQQLPIDAMVKVGTYKQQKYDEGVQKIQGYVDNIAGLDVMHESDKAYLQAKLNQLGDRLKGVAAGDFSNQQLVTSVGGMATQISKDANVQNAVSSTAWHRRQIETIEAARKEGKTAASNIANYDKQVKAYLDNKEAGQVFRGQYSPYRDVNKKVFEAIKLVHSSAQSLDQAYQIDPKTGKIDMNNILAALKRQGIESVNEGTLRTAIGAALDSEDYHQLYIDGEYQLSGTAPEKLREYAMEDYQKSRDYAKEQIERIKEQLLTTSTIAGQNQLNKSLRYFEDELGNPAKGITGRLDKNYRSTVQSINDNPDAARGKIYAKNYIDQFANGYAWANVKDELLNNPVREDYWKNEANKLAQIKEGHDYALGLGKLKVDQRNAATNELEAQIKLKTLENTYDPTKPYFAGAGDETDVETSYENYVNYNNNLKGANDDILNTMSDLVSDVNTRVPKSQLEKNITDYQNGKYKPGTADEARLMDRYIENKNLLKNNEALHSKIRNQAYEKLTGLNENDYKKTTIGNRNPITLTDKNGNKVTYSPSEVYDYLSKEEATTDVAGDTPVSTIKITKSLSPKEKLLQEKLKNRYLGLPGGDKVLNAYISDFDQAFAKSKAVDRKVYQEVITRLAPYTGAFRTEESGITFGKAAEGTDKKSFVTALSTFIKSDIDMKTAGPDYKPLKAMEKLAGKNLENVEFLFRRAGDSYSVNIVDKDDPTNNQILKVPEDWIRTNNVLKQGYLNSNTELASVLLRGGNSTSAFKGGEDGYKYAYYQQGKIGRYDVNGTKTVTLPVAANLTKGSDGKLYPTFYMKTADGPINIKLFDPVTKSQFENQYLPGLTNDDILNLFRSKYSNIDQLIPQ